jgi:hypothetical protein
VGVAGGVQLAAQAGAAGGEGHGQPLRAPGGKRQVQAKRAAARPRGKAAPPPPPGSRPGRSSATWRGACGGTRLGARGAVQVRLASLERQGRRAERERARVRRACVRACVLLCCLRARRARAASGGGERPSELLNFPASC